MKFIFFSFLFFSFSVYAELSESCKDIFYDKLKNFKMVTRDSGEHQAALGLNSDIKDEKIYYYFVKKGTRKNPLPSFYIKEKGDTVEMNLYQGKVLSSNNDIKTIISYNSDCSEILNIHAYRGSTQVNLNRDVCDQYSKKSTSGNNNCIEENKVEGLFYFEFQKLGYGSLCNDNFPEDEPVIEVPESSSAESSFAIGS